NINAMRITRHTELEVYRKAFAAAMDFFRVSRAFPMEERYSLTDQCRRSSRSVCANITEAWRKRRYPASFIAKLSDAEGEAAETQTWLQFAVDCGYLDREKSQLLITEYDAILGMLVRMISAPDSWTLPNRIK
ncbi:MAG TPA: four helix bundle protein, partial [Luteolibacter sp.]|nr:four helix bundle protein [Luteolibacter sp.]